MVIKFLAPINYLTNNSFLINYLSLHNQILTTNSLAIILLKQIEAIEVITISDKNIETVKWIKKL